MCVVVAVVVVAVMVIVIGVVFVLLSRVVAVCRGIKCEPSSKHTTGHVTMIVIPAKDSRPQVGDPLFSNQLHAVRHVAGECTTRPIFLLEPLRIVCFSRGGVDNRRFS